MHWNEISEQLPGRTPTSCRLHYRRLQRHVGGGMMLVNTSWLGHTTGQSSERADQDQPAFVPHPICPV